MSDGFDYSRFARLSEGFTGGAVRVDPLDAEVDAYALVRGDAEPPVPFRFRWDEGRTLHDLVGTTLPPLTLYSDRVVATLRDGGFRGWRTYEVAVTDRSEKPLEGLHGLVVEGRCGPLVEEMSELVTQPAPSPRGRPREQLQGLYFDPDRWDGSDVFMPDGTSFTIVSQAVVDALNEAGATNMKLQPLPEVLRPVLRRRDSG